MKRLSVIVLAVMLAMNSIINFASIRAQAGTASRPDSSGQSQKGFSPEQERALRELAPKLSRFDVDQNGVPSWLMGDLGPAVGDPHNAAMEAMRRLAPAFRMTADDGFDVRKATSDDEGQMHVRLQQRYRGLLVVGSEVIVHLEGNKVVGVNGRFTPDINVGNTPELTAEAALDIARRSLSAKMSELPSPELVVFIAPDNLPHLAWRQKGTYVDGEGLQRDWIFADARSGALLGRHSLIHTARFRQIYDGNQLCLSTLTLTQLPGSFLFDEGVSSLELATADEAARGAYRGTGKTYDFYKNVFNRDSYDGFGSHIVSSVHVQFARSNGECTPNNAAWVDDAQQMVYGDGDGVNVGLLSTSLDVTAHELTHAVTSKEAALIYQGEPGALNEATSDILGESVDYFINGSTDWKIGEDVYTPGVAGDALRYMNDPVLDDPQVSDIEYVSSRDYYPDRYTGSGDHGGVHFNSGIANLFFHLLSMGGAHPRGKTRVPVPAIGIEQARAIWFFAVRDYMISTTDFAGARTATAEAAAAIYQCTPNLKAAVVDAVHKAWDAVGVSNNEQNGWTMLGLSGPTFNTFLPCVTPTFNLLLNPNFEREKILWTALPSSVITNSASQPAYSGDWKALMGGTGMTTTHILHQKVTIPSVAATATLSFQLHIDSAESGATIRDKLQVQLRDPNNNVLKTLDTYYNYEENSGYTLQTFDVTAYKGQTLRVYFKATENASNQTSFVIDNVRLNVD